GLLQLFAGELGLDIPTATHAVEAYALGVVLGGPAATLLAAKLNRRHLLLALMALFVAGNLLSAMAAGFGSFTLARFLSGIPQGA
ncbi:MFS transporter, partial [Listeria monocytogenes]